MKLLVLRRFALCLVIIGLFPISGWALATPPKVLNYYGVDNDSELSQLPFSPEFRKQLQSHLARFQRSLGYTEARRYMFGELHLDKTGSSYTVQCVYCEVDYRTPGPLKIPNSKALNTEHTWPQSRFAKKHKDYQKTDLHALFPTTPTANSSRGNLEFGEVQYATSSPCPLSKRGPVVGGSKTVFEPPEMHKGNIARALFYFAVRYELKISPSEERFLRAWHEEDPVDLEEIQRNEKVFEIQGSRNPFVDFPDWVDHIADF